MSTNLTFQPPGNVTGDIYAVNFTNLLDGRILMTYAWDSGGSADEVYYTFLDGDLNSLGGFPVKVGDAVQDRDVKAVATPEGGFAIMFNETPPYLQTNSETIVRYAADGTLITKYSILGEGFQYDLTALNNGDIVASNFWSPSAQEFVYAQAFPIFGSVDSGYTRLDSTVNTDVEGKISAPIFANGEPYVPTLIYNTNTGDNEFWLLRVAENAFDASPVGVQVATSNIAWNGYYGGINAVHLDNGNILVMYWDRGQSINFTVYDETLSTVISTSTGAFGGTYGIEVLKRPDGSFVVAGFNISNSSMSVYEIDETGTNVVSRTQVNTGVGTSSSVYTDEIWTDLVNLEAGGWAAVLSPSQAPSSFERLIIFDQGTEGADIHSMGGSQTFFNGLGGADLLGGSSADETMVGGDGSDGIWGNGGDDKIYLDQQPEANPSFDYVFDSGYGGEGNDLIRNDYGNSVMQGEDGNDSLIGGSNEDEAWGGDGKDYMKLGNGNDYADGGRDNDVLIMGSGQDTAYGGLQNDYIRGGYGNDLLFGDFGKDVILGGFGSDTLDGGNGDDKLNGGADDDTLIGGRGDDTFIFSGDGDPFAETFESDYVQDFVQGEDMIRIRKATDVSSYNDLDVFKLGDQTIVQYNNREIVVNSNLSSTDFEFV
ncbi:MAG: calcium-binding protein [Pseudomonadota bacterium]